MRRATLCLALLAVLAACPATLRSQEANPRVQAKPAIAAHLPTDEISVTADYHGTRLLIYGTVSRDCDVIVKLSSPRVTTTYAQKGRVGIFWFSVGKVTFENVPWMFKIKSTRPIDKILYLEDQIRYRVGMRGLIESIKAPPETPPILVDELIQTRIEDQLYSFHEGDVKRVKGNMFEASFYWPPKAPPGTYHIDSIAVRNGKVVSIDSEKVKVEKVGVEAWVSGLATGHGFIYGIVAVVVAMFAGLIVGLVFRGMGPGRKKGAQAVH